MNQKNLNWNYRCQKKRAFTLLELIIVIFISSIIVGIFSMLLDFSIKTLEYSYTIDDDASAGIHCLNQIVEEIEESEKVYDSKDFILNKDYGDSLGFVLKKRYENRFAYIYFAHRDGIVWRIAYNTHIDNPAEISFGNLKDKGVNAISDGILSVENSNFDDKSGLISLNIKVSEDKNGNYSTQIYRGK